MHIRGIIATEKIKTGAIIERCPVILVPIQEEKNLNKTVLWRYYYEWNQKYHAITLGYGGLINHSYAPNAKYTYDYKNYFLVYRAIKDIQIGEEIFVNYNHDPDSKEKLEKELLDFNAHYKYPAK